VTSPDKPQLGVEVELNHLDGGQVALNVRVLPDDVNNAKSQIIKGFAGRANIPGFRKGKAPLSVAARHMDPDLLKEQIIDQLVSDAYDVALAQVDIKPLDRARIQDTDLADDGALTFTATVTLRPEITIGEYKSLKATRRITPVTDAQVDAELNRLRTRNAAFTDLPEGAAIEKGDLAVVDYDMLIDGEKREDASASGYPLEVGADNLFPELNQALSGAHPGDTIDVDVTYPDTHSDKSLAGKTAKFKVTVAQARRRQLPDLDDDFAKKVADLDSAEALRTRLRERLEQIGAAIAEDDLRNQLIRQVSDAASLDVPQSLVDRETDRRIDETTEELERRNLTLHQHLQQIGRSFEDWRADIEVDARAAARRAIILDEIGSSENLEVTDEDIHEEIHRLAETEQIDEHQLHERLADSPEFNRLVNRLYHRKVVQFLVDNAEITEEITEPTDDDQPELSGSSDQPVDKEPAPPETGSPDQPAEKEPAPPAAASPDQPADKEPTPPAADS